MAFPLLVENVAFGALNVYARCERAFGPVERETGSLFASQAAIVRVTHHAHNLTRRLFERRPHAFAHVDLLADRVLLREILLLKCLQGPCRFYCFNAL